MPSFRGIEIVRRNLLSFLFVIDRDRNSNLALDSFDLALRLVDHGCLKAGARNPTPQPDASPGVRYVKRIVRLQFTYQSKP